MAGVTGLEPAASGVTGQRSNQLSYTPQSTWLQVAFDLRATLMAVKSRLSPCPKIWVR